MGKLSHRIIVMLVVFFGTAGLFDSAIRAEIFPSPRQKPYLYTTAKTFEHHCSPCHGINGDGKGTFFTIDLNPKPRDFTDPEYMSTRTDDQLLNVITGGSASVGLSNLCPPWGGILSEEKIKSLVQYVRDFSKGEEPEGVKATEAEGVEKVEEEKEGKLVKSVLRWIFITVITVGLAGGAFSEWKKLKSESKT